MAKVVRSGQVQDRFLKTESTGLLMDCKWESSTMLNPIMGTLIMGILDMVTKPMDKTDRQCA